jgi:hypothetical protein
VFTSLCFARVEIYVKHTGKGDKNLGCCQAVFIDTVRDDFSRPMKQQRTKEKDGEEEEENEQDGKEEEKGQEV